MEDDFKLIAPRWVHHSKRPISTIDFHPTEDIFATGGWDCFAKIWSLNAVKGDTKVKAKLISLLKDHSKPVNCVRFSPDGKFLATCGDDQMVFIWQQASAYSSPSCFGIPDNALFPNEPIRRWNSRGLRGHTGDVSSLSWFGDSRKIVSCSLDGGIIAWDVRAGVTIWIYKARVGAQAIAVDPLNRFIVVQLMDSSLSIFDVHGRHISDIPVPSGESLVSRIAWTPDGSFFGANSGFHDGYTVPFFSRDTFQESFAVEGHITQTTCIAPRRTLSKGDDGYSSIVAIADKAGNISLWEIGGSPEPLTVLAGVSNSAIHDLSWSPSGNLLAVALESDPISQNGGVLFFDFKLKPCIDEDEMASVRWDLLGENSFRRKTAASAEVTRLLKALERPEKDVDVELLQLTTQEVLNMQQERIEDGIKIIVPVLLTAVEKKSVYFTTSVKVTSKTKRAPFEFSPQGKNWFKPAALQGEPTHVVECGSFMLVGYGAFVLKLSSKTGRRLSLPLHVEGPLRHLSCENGVCLAVGGRCFLIDMEHMEVISQCCCPDAFCSFTLLPPKVVMAYCKGHVWFWNGDAKEWFGGSLSGSSSDLSISEIEQIALQNPNESAISQWFDLAVSVIFSAYTGNQDQLNEYLDKFRYQVSTKKAQKFFNSLMNVLKKRWSV